MVLPPPSPKPGFGLSPNSGRCAGWLSTTGRRRRPGPKSRPLPGVGNQRGNYKGAAGAGEGTEDGGDPGPPFRGVDASSRTGDVLDVRQRPRIRNIPRFAPANHPPQGGTRPGDPALRAATSTGRPQGNETFLEVIERTLERSVRPLPIGRQKGWRKHPDGDQTL